MKKEKLFTVTQAARMLCMGRNNLLKLLRNNGFMYSSVSMRNSPTKWAVEQRLLQPKSTEFFRGPVRVEHITALVTPKGMVWIRDLIEEQTKPQAS
ncbi:phage antirepressor KilAC domain-containing protein [Microbulbifer sp. PSTR4-B]|uniref:phage antirepressor KilAC domain-containing protein n=1 Tax=Microbulbifer sp. PSTR4-B TaxID=3243396 RepID=UPI004039E0D8